MSKRRLKSAKLLVGKQLGEKYGRAFICVLLFFPSVSFAACPGSPPAGIDCVEVAAVKNITAFTVCRKVTNNHASSKSLMVPIKTSTEWTDFYTSPPAGVTIASCP